MSSKNKLANFRYKLLSLESAGYVPPQLLLRTTRGLGRCSQPNLKAKASKVRHEGNDYESTSTLIRRKIGALEYSDTESLEHDPLFAAFLKKGSNLNNQIPGNMMGSQISKSISPTIMQLCTSRKLLKRSCDCFLHDP